MRELWGQNRVIRRKECAVRMGHLLGKMSLLPSSQKQVPRTLLPHTPLAGRSSHRNESPALSDAPQAACDAPPAFASSLKHLALFLTRMHMPVCVFKWLIPPPGAKGQNTGKEIDPASYRIVTTRCHPKEADSSPEK